MSALDWVRGLCQFSDFTNGTEQICACVCVGVLLVRLVLLSGTTVISKCTLDLSWNISLHFEVALHVITTSDGIAKE